jgi:predicted enzyme involved in methoxymalonyl-ACP biosynthesis
VERPGAGDFARAYDERVNGMSSHFTWVNRSKESLTLDLLVQQAKAWGCDRLIGEYIPSLKNEMVSQHYLKMGFHLIKENTFELKLMSTQALESHITLKETL